MKRNKEIKVSNLREGTRRADMLAGQFAAAREPEKLAKRVSSGFLSFALFAFLGLGMEMALIQVEPFLYGIPIKQWTTFEFCSHWFLTCIIWLLFSLVLIYISKHRYQFDIFANKDKVDIKAWIIAISLVVIGIIGLNVVWGGLKVVKEYNNLGMIKFIFQYIYYLFEMVLVILVIVFGQKFGEMVTKNEKIPWGGMTLSLTWGLVHILSQDVATGILSITMSFLFGILYLLMNKDVRWSYLLIAIIFIV